MIVFHHSSTNALPFCSVKSLCWNTVCAADYAQRCIQLHSTESKPDFSMWSKNTVGSELLNCGYDEKNRKFLPCDEKDKMCGAFHCSPIEYAPKTKGTTMFDMFTTVNKFTPLMMPNVTYCGLDSICLDTKCVHKKNLPQMVSQQCPFDCYGWGQCMYGGVCKCQSFDDFIDLKTCRRPVIAGALPTGKPALDENDEKQGKAETEGVETVATALFHSPSLIPWWFWLLLMLLLLFIIFLVFLTQRGRTEQTNVRLNPSTDQSSTVEAAKNAANLSPLPAPAMGSAVNRTPKKTPKPPLKTRIKEASVIPYSSTGFSTIAPAMTPSMTPSTGSFLSKSPDAIRDAKRKSTSRIPLIKSPLKMTNKTYVSNVSAISTSPVSRRK